MALNFPNSPADGEKTTQPNGVTYQWSAAMTRWNAVSTPFDSADKFSNFLDGYAVTGLHEEYIGDLNDILNNSAYFIAPTNVTNAPLDFLLGGAFIRTFMYSVDSSSETQIMYGMSNPDNYWKQWMRQKVANVWGAWKLVIDGLAYQQLVSIAPNGGTTIKFDIPIGARKITLSFNNIACTAITQFRVQLSVSGAFITTGYVAKGTRIANGAATNVISFTSGIPIGANNISASEPVSGRWVAEKVEGQNTWIVNGQATNDSQPHSFMSTGYRGGVVDLDAIRIIISSGVFVAAGQVSCAFE